jgi:hypothetical protein
MDVATLGIRVDASGAITVLDKFGNTVEKVDHKVSGLESKLKHLALFLAEGFLAHKFLHETIEAQNALAQLEAAVAATGGSAGKTVKELDDLSFEIQRTTTFSDEAAKAALTMLLTFNKIDGRRMKDAADIAANLATRMGGDLVSAAQMVGKALQDPAQGITMIQRQFRLFNESQLETIKRLQETGHFAEAQGMVFDAMSKKFAGASAAARNTLGGSLKYLGNTFNDLFEVSQGGTSLLVKGINAAGDALENFKDKMGVVLAVIGAATTAWLTYRAVVISVTAAQAIISGAQTVAAFVQLALTVRKLADATALVSLFSGSLVKAAATVAALVLGWVAYKKIMEQVNKESKKFTDGLPSITTPSGPDGDVQTKLQRDIAFQNAERVRTAKQELELIGLMGPALEHQKNIQESINDDRQTANARGLDETQDLDEATVRAIADVRRLKDQAIFARLQFDALKKVLDGMQSAFADFFTNLFNDGIKSFQNLAKAFKDLFTKVIADILAQRVMQRLISLIDGGKNSNLGALQITAGATMLAAAKLQLAAAGAMATAAGVTPPTAPGGGGGGPSPIYNLPKKVGNIGIGLAGLGVGYGLGNSIGGAGGVLAGAAGGAATGAALGAQIGAVGGPAGAAIGGIAGFVGGLIGVGAAAKRQREEMKQLQAQHEAFTDSIKVQLGILSDVDAQVKETKRVFDEQRRQAFGGWTPDGKVPKGVKLPPDLYAAWDEMSRLEAARIQQIRDEAAAIKQAKVDSIQARLLEVNGDTAGAAALRLRIQQEEEYRQAVKDGLDEATLATLRYVQAKEAEKAAADAFVSTALNIPEGYKIQAAQFQATNAWNDPYGPGWERQTSGSGRLGAASSSSGPGEGAPVVLVMDGQVVAKGVIRNAQKLASGQFGDPSKWSQVSVS